MNRSSILFVLSVLALALAAASTSEDVNANHNHQLAVTITNLTKGQVFSPPIIATHHRRLTPLFELGAKASDELAALAEDGKTGPLEKIWKDDPLVKEVVTAGDPIPPGESATVYINASYSYDNMTVAGMLVSSNDAFFALNGVKLSRYDWKTYQSAAYDAGSEDNNEMCAFIPGPPCMNGAGMRDTDGAEGYVYIHSGIHGSADLMASVRDWNNPVAKITVRRVR